MENDDAPVGRVLSRREVVRLFAVAGAAVAMGCRTEGEATTDGAGAGTTALDAAGTSARVPACVVQPELTVGPYFVDKQLDRSDIRTEPTSGHVSQGVPLVLTFALSRVDGGQCRPLGGAMVDVWHCDAAGVYSGVDDPMLGTSNTGTKFLRGYQTTDAGGVARFTTIYPGWYRGRTVHVHFKVRTPGSAALAGQNGVYEFTSQLFFDERLSDSVYGKAPYIGKGQRDTTNATDGIFQESGGQLVLNVAEGTSDYTANFELGLDLSDAAVGAPDRNGGPGGRGPRGGPPPGARRGGQPPRRPGAAE